MKLIDFLEQHFIPERGRLSAGYYYRLRLEVRRFTEWLQRAADVEDLADAMVRRFLAEQPETLSAATVNTTRGVLMALWNAAAEKDLVAPPGRLPKIREPGRMPEAWTLFQLGRMITQATSLKGDVGETPRCEWWPSLILAIYSTGARIASLLAVESTDCSLEDQYVILRAEHTKSGIDSYKALSDQTVVALRPMYDLKRRLVWEWPYNRRYLWYFFRHWIVEASGMSASLTGMSLFHKIRRSSLSYAASIDMDLARQQADHADIRTTAKHYLDPRIVQGRRAGNLLPSVPFVKLR